MKSTETLAIPHDLLGKIDANVTYSQVRSLARQLKPFLSDARAAGSQSGLGRTRIALTGSYTLSFLRDPLDVFLASHGLVADWFVGEFDNYHRELIDPESSLYAFNPQIVVILIDHRAVSAWPAVGSSLAEVRALAARQMESWEQLWDRVRETTGAAVIHANLALPLERTFGNFESKSVWSTTFFIRELNQLLAERSPGHVTVCDADHLSGVVGKRTWFDEPTRLTTGQGVGFEGLCLLARTLSAMIAATLGRAKKCLVLDLDNTLWGGVVGDVGVEGLVLGPGDPVGEAFTEFQQYCKQLKDRGIILAVCSKNDIANARSAFESHPGMVLTLDDISMFVANWTDKATNIRQIAAHLNIGVDSLVFVDDNPAERALIRQELPSVAVPEMPPDPALYRRVVDRGSYFELSALSREDLDRTAYYVADQKRKALSDNVTDLPTYLRSLEQVCEVGPFDDLNLQRIVQLINKTNQWNLTTLRMTEGEVHHCMTDPRCYTLSVRHGDAFGDNGLVAVLLAQQVGDVLSIKNWLMSCRVIGRGVEHLVFNELLAEAGTRQVRLIHGEYRPTTKNSMVATLYQDLGLRCSERRDDGVTLWEGDRSLLSPASHYITRTFRTPRTHGGT